MADVSRFQRNMRLAQTETGFTVRNFGRMSDAMAKNGVTAGVLGTAFHVVAGALRAVAIAGGAAVAVFVSLAAKTSSMFGEYEEQMARVRAVTSGSREDFDDLSKTIEKTAVKMKTSSMEMAKGAEFLGMAGFSAAESAQLLGNVTNLAQIGMMQLGDASDIATNIVAGLGIEYSNAAELGEKFGRVTDIMAKTMSTANTNMRQLGDAFKYVAPVIENGEKNFADASAAIGLLANAGLQGEMGGTALRNMMLRVLSPTAKMRRAIERGKMDVDKMTGSFVGLIEEVEKANLSKENIATIFGARALPGIMRLLGEGSEKMKKYVEALEDSKGVAQAMGEVMRNTLNAQMKALGERFTQIARIAGGEFAIAIRTAILYVTWLAHASGLTKKGFKELVRDGINKFIQISAKVVLAIGTLIQWAGKLTDFFRMVGFTLEVVMGGVQFIFTAAAAGFVGMINQMVQGYAKLMDFMHGFGLVDDWDVEYAKKQAKEMEGVYQSISESAAKAFKDTKKTFDDFDPFKYTNLSNTASAQADEVARHMLQFGEILKGAQRKADQSKSTFEDFMKELDLLGKKIWTGGNNLNLDGDTGDGGKQVKQANALAAAMQKAGAARSAAAQAADDRANSLSAQMEELKQWGQEMDEFYPKLVDPFEAAIPAAERLKVALGGIAMMSDLSGRTGIGQLMSQELERLNFEKRQSFLQETERQIEAQERLNQTIIDQVAALDQVQAKIGSVSNQMVKSVHAYANAKEGVEKMNAEMQLTATAMGAISEIGPALFRAMGMNAKQQAIAQATLNGIMALFALGMGLMRASMGDPRAAGYFAAAAAFGGKAIAGAVGVAKMSELKATERAPGQDMDSRSGNNYSVTRDAIIEALKEAGLYQVGWDRLTLENYGTTPVAFEPGKSARQARATEKNNQIAARIRG